MVLDTWLRMRAVECRSQATLPRIEVRGLTHEPKQWKGVKRNSGPYRCKIQRCRFLTGGGAALTNNTQSVTTWKAMVKTIATVRRATVKTTVQK